MDSPDVALVSATGSERMGAEIAPRVAARMGRTLLELGGNNAAVVAPSADLELAKRGIVFAAAGTAGQRCTTLRRVIAHDDVVDELVAGLRDVFGRLQIGDPGAAGTLVGPLINEQAYQEMAAALEQAQADGGELVVGGGRRAAAGLPNAYYVEPAIVRMPAQTELVRRETFAPILYVMTYGDFEDAIALHNGVPQGLSSSIFTRDQREAERFLAVRRLGLRDRQRQHRDLRRRDRRRVRRREVDRRRPRVRLRRVARLHAPGNQHHQLLRRAPAGPGGGVWVRSLLARVSR